MSNFPTLINGSDLNNILQFCQLYFMLIFRIFTDFAYFIKDKLSFNQNKRKQNENDDSMTVPDHYSGRLISNRFISQISIYRHRYIGIGVCAKNKMCKSAIISISDFCTKNREEVRFY